MKCDTKRLRWSPTNKAYTCFAQSSPLQLVLPFTEVACALALDAAVVVQAYYLRTSISETYLEHYKTSSVWSGDYETL
jgi:hypothetical protein